jgi:peptidoglycan/LPS O-acetylase OafA/YrhL
MQHDLCWRCGVYFAEFRNRKRRSVAEAFNPTKNAFAFLRLILAALVIFYHCFVLGGFGLDPLQVIGEKHYSFGSVGVSMFFVLSGFLISRSALSSLSFGRFLWHRFLRIFPGYWMCLVVCAFVFAPLVAFQEQGTLLGIFSAPTDSPQSYVIGNAMLFHLNGFTILGVMDIHPSSIANLMGHNPLPRTINGSLWTLPFEFSCYLAVGGLAILGVLRRGRLTVLALFVGLWSVHALIYVSQQAFSYWPSILVEFSLYFSAGSVCFLYREKIPCSTALFIASVILLAVSLMYGGIRLVAPVAMSYAFLWLAFKLPVTRFDTRGDFSYGAYIYAFPVQQGLVLLHVHEGGWGLYLIWSVLITGILAILSYRWIEAPCLQWKHVDLAEAFRHLIRKPSVASVGETSARMP